jgi:hypothetical protein
MIWKVKIPQCSFCFKHWYVVRLFYSKINKDVAICKNCLKVCKELKNGQN